ncbi:MAG TPA: DedA family protein [Lamprocystis sp. (in: g-proteobacteria)]|nr:DedA family protein [Lamprocystis sp. (in: g-proteobacteria)]
MPNHNLSIRLALTFVLLLGPGMGPMAAPEPAPEPAAAPTETLRQRLTTDLKHDIARVQPWLDRYGYGAVAVAVGVEGAGVPAPGETLLIAAAADAVTSPRLHIGWLLLAAFAAAALGNTVGYLIGRWGGRGLLRRLRINDRHLDRVDVAFARWGGWVIAFARFFDGLRQLNGIAAGILGMPWQRFTLFNLLGAALWVGFWGIGVYYLDEHLTDIAALIHRVNPWIAATTLTVVGVLALLTWRRLAGQKAADKAA